MITLTSSSGQEAILLSNLFIDHYMPEANGEFVKVYIYLIRILSTAPISFSLEKMADTLLCTEKDIQRALKYWAKTGLLSLDYDSRKQICGIHLNPLPRTAETSAQKPSGETLTEAATSADLPKENPTVKEKAPQSPSLSASRIRELKQNEDIVQLLYIAEQYLGKTLTSTEMQKILYFYDELKMSSVLIEYLIEYCVTKNHRSIRYMESVALAWVKDGIRTVEEARSASSLFQKEYFTILKYLGISGRNPVENEISFMNTWLSSYGFSMDIIHEACSRTVLKTGQPSFQYTDSILRDWKAHSVHTLADIQTLDDQHKKKSTSRSTPKKASDKPAAQNRFNNFQQREYDFAEYEKLLLNQ